MEKDGQQKPGFSFFQNRDCPYFPVIRQSARTDSTACSAIALFIHWGGTAAGISVGRKTA